MISHAILNDRLGLDRRSFTELATGLSVIAVTGATLYNLGFFAPIEWSLISLLTVQDMLIGSVIAAAPMTVAACVALLFGKLIRLAPSRAGLAMILGLPVLLTSGFGFFYFFTGPGQSTLGHLACGYIVLGVFAAGANILCRTRRMPVFWLVFSLLYIPTVMGMSDSAIASGGTRPVSQVETDKGIITGRIVRVTSAYLLIAHDNAIITMPMNKVREIRRIYIRSPEADFLSGATIVGPLSPARGEAVRE